MQQQIGKYTLIRKLATGGMAEVYLARAEGPMGFAKTLVLKRILPHLAEDQNFVEMFLGEAKLAAQLNHPNVVQIFDFGESEGAYFIAMEFIDGPNLRALARRAAEVGQKLPLALCAKAISFACEGLAFAHEFCDGETGEELGLIHRDISPDNILLSKQGAVKVVDFGIAKAAGQGHHTKTGTLKGKLAYMPPEQLSGKQLDRRTDIFALGIVLYELICGQKPFDATSEVSIMQAILYEPLIPANSRREDVPEAMLQILDRAMAKNRDERYATCREFQADLERFILSTGEPVGAYQLSQLVAQLAAPQGAPTATPPGAGSGPKSNPGVPPRTPSSANVQAQRTPSGANIPAQRTPSSANVPAQRTPSTPNMPAQRTPVSSPNLQAQRTPPSNPQLQPQLPNPPPRTASNPNVAKAPSSPEFEPQSMASVEVPLETAVTAALGPSHAQPAQEADVIPLTSRRPAEPQKSRAPIFVGAAGLALVAVAAGIVFLKKSPDPQPQPLPVAVVTPDVKPKVETPPPDVKPPDVKVEVKPDVKPVEVQQPPAEEPKQLAVVDAGVPPQEQVAVVEEPPVEKVEKGGKSSKKKKNEREEKKKTGSVATNVVTQTTETKTIVIPASGGVVKESPAALASFEVVSVPAAQVKVNGHFVSMSPAKVQNLAPGEVKVEVYDSKAGFSKSQTFTIQAGDNGTKRIVVEQGTLEFRIRPYATVFLDGKPLGETPIPPVPVFEGSHEIKMINRDLKVDKTVSFVARGGTNTFKFNLEE